MNKAQNLIFPIMVLLILLLITRQEKNSFFIDFTEAKIASTEEKKPLLIIFDLRDKKELENMKNLKDYIVCFLEYEKDNKIFQQFKIKKIPAYIIIDEKTNAIFKEEGYKNKLKLTEWLRKVKSKTKD